MRERKRMSYEEKGGVACCCLLLVWQFDPLWLMTLCFWTLEEPHRRLIEDFELQMCETKALATRRNPFLFWKFSEMDFLPHFAILGVVLPTLQWPRKPSPLTFDSLAPQSYL